MYITYCSGENHIGLLDEMASLVHKTFGDVREIVHSTRVYLVCVYLYQSLTLVLFLN